MKGITMNQTLKSIALFTVDYIAELMPFTVFCALIFCAYFSL